MLDAAHRKVRMADPGGSKEAPKRPTLRRPSGLTVRYAARPPTRRPGSGRMRPSPNRDGRPTSADLLPLFRPPGAHAPAVTFQSRTESSPRRTSPPGHPPCRGPARAAPRGHIRPALRCEGRGRGHTGAHLKAQGEPRSITATGPPRRAGSAASGASRAPAARPAAARAVALAAGARLAQWRRARSPGASSRAPRPSGEGRCGCRPQRSAPRAEGRRDSCCRPFVTRAIRFCGGSLRLGHRRRCGASPSPCSRRQLRMTHYPMKGRCVPRATSR